MSRNKSLQKIIKSGKKIIKIILYLLSKYDKITKTTIIGGISPKLKIGADKYRLMAQYIEEKEIKKQKEFLYKIKELNQHFAELNGHAPLAKTETYGCQQNENDTERIRGMLHDAGFEFCDDEKLADVVIYNTCAVRENAEQKVFGRIGILKHINLGL